jgi:hypothetical protein
MLNKQKNAHMDLWKNYITDGLPLHCSAQELEQFINNFGKPHSICRQCPSEHDLDSIIDHRKRVEYK